MDDWFGRQQFELILAVGGNHDLAAQDREEHGEEVFENAVYLCDESIEFGDIKFYGAPWVPRLPGWAYYLSDSKLRRRWELIPEDTEVLITHTPPFGILDTPKKGDSQGCPHLRSRVEQLPKLRLHCFGHIHASYGRQQAGSTVFCNAALQFGAKLGSPIRVDL